MGKILNLELLKNPYNYIVVGLMVFIAGVVIHLIFPQFGAKRVGV